jgi:CubicO group peptidase (beta-lactamase class C family)
MAHRIYKNCLYCSLILTFMLFYQAANAQYNFSAADNWLEQNTKDMGGRSVLMIFKDGKIIYSKSVNKLNSKQKFIGKAIAKKKGKDAGEILEDYSLDKKILIASCSKWLSAALVMTFVDEGKLKLTDTIGKFLPVFSAAGKGNITIQNCLSHMTGIKSGDIKESRAGFEKSATMDEAMSSIAALPMESAPGESFHYSSIGLQIAAGVIEKISGKDFRTLFAERIAKPCGMLNTDFGNNPIPVPAGSGQSTPADYLRFLEMILNNGNYNGKQVLSKESVQVMQYNYAAGKKVISSPAEAKNWGYGLGEWTPESSDAHTRSDFATSPGLFGSFPWVNNKLGYAGVLFTFYIKNKGRNERYTGLKSIIDAAVTNK